MTSVPEVVSSRPHLVLRVRTKIKYNRRGLQILVLTFMSIRVQCMARRAYSALHIPENSFRA